MAESSRMHHHRHASLKTVRELAPDTPNPVRIVCIVVEARDGIALVQDIMDTPGKQGSIHVDVAGQLAIAEKYILIGDVKTVTGPDGKELRIVVSASHNINGLDVKLYKESLQSTERINRANRVVQSL